MHRAVLLASAKEIDSDAILLTGEGMSPLIGGAVTAAPAAPPAQQAPPASAPSSAAGDADGGQSLVGRTVADVERDLIIDTLEHCLGNRTHAANILGISIRTLRNKLKIYNDEGVAVPTLGDGERNGL